MILLIKSKKIFAFLAILNSIYLSYIYLEGFMLNSYSKNLIEQFTLPLFTIPFIFLTLFIISFLKNIKLSEIKKEKKFLKILIGLAFYIFLFLIWYILGKIVFEKIRHNNLGDFIQITNSIIIEIITVVFAVENVKTEKIYKLLKIILLWVYCGIITFLITGIFASMGYDFLNDVNLQLLYSGIFFHLINASFLYDNFLLKNKI